MNFYEKNSACLPCPGGTATEFIRSTQCLKSCSVGEFRYNETDCMKCPFGTYQPLSRHAQSVCRYCPQGTTTVALGSVAMVGCIGNINRKFIYELHLLIFTNILLVYVKNEKFQTNLWFNLYEIRKDNSSNNKFFEWYFSRNYSCPNFFFLNIVGELEKNVGQVLP